MAIQNLSQQPLSLLSQIELSPITRYYLTQLIRQNLDHLILDDMREVPQDSPQDSIVQQRPVLQDSHLRLERLAMEHQTLISQGAIHQDSVKGIEAEILQMIGLRVDDTHRKGTILVVDDTPEVLRFFTQALTQQGYEVCSAISGSIALNHIPTIEPSLILLDIMMPGLDGYEVCERLKANEQTAEIPVIFMSAIHEPLDKVRAFNLGGVDYLTKPIQIEELLVRIEHQLTLKRLQDHLKSQSNVPIVDENSVYEDFWNRSMDGFYRASVDGKFLMVNPAYAKILGYTRPNQVIQQITSIAQQVYRSPGRWSELVTCLQQFESVVQFESPIQTASGEIRWIAESVRLIQDETGLIYTLEGTVRNITDRIQADRASATDSLKRDFQD
jgi:PAS domain S-box-containing protein